MDTARVVVITTGGEAEDLMDEARIHGEVEVPAVRQTGEAGLHLILVVRGRVWSWTGIRYIIISVINTSYFQTKSH